VLWGAWSVAITSITPFDRPSLIASTSLSVLRQGGYLRIVKKGVRKGDGASVSVIQLLPADESAKSREKKAKRSSAGKKKEEKG